MPRLIKKSRKPTLKKGAPKIVNDKRTDPLQRRQNQAIEALCVAAETRLRAFKDKALLSEEKLPASFGIEEKIIWVELIRQTLIEAAEVKLPEHLQRQLPPWALERFKQVCSVLIPSVH